MYTSYCGALKIPYSLISVFDKKNMYKDIDIFVEGLSR